METAVRHKLDPARFRENLAMFEQLEQQQAQFIRVVVHELKSPVAGAKTLIEVMRLHDAVSGSTVIPLIDKISKRMGQMCDLIKYLLDLSQPASGELPSQVSTIDIGAETELGCEPYREQAKLKGVTLGVRLPKELVEARLDARGYRLVLSNLVSNAIKYTPAGSVTVSVEAQESWVVLSVNDTGMGIPEAEVPSLYREGFRASNARAHNIEGSGVGLAGAKSLVERLGGTLSLETKENAGSTFTVRLPAGHHASDAPAHSGGLNAANSQATGSRRILLRESPRVAQRQPRIQGRETSLRPCA